MSKVDWIIHMVANGVPCDDCGKVEDSFLPYICNAHTHGMEKYNHMDFQMVISYSQQEIMRILNTFGIWVRDGRTFHAGELIDGIYEDCPVRLDEFTESGRTVLRVVIPDRNNKFPEDSDCMEPYKYQALDTGALYKKEGADA